MAFILVLSRFEDTLLCAKRFAKKSRRSVSVCLVEHSSSTISGPSKFPGSLDLGCTRTVMEGISNHKHRS